MPSQATLELLPALYETIDDPAAWPDFLARVASTIGGFMPLITVADRESDAASLFVELGADPQVRRAYDEEYVDHDPRRKRIQHLGEGGVFIGHDLLPDATLRRSSFYEGFLRPNGFFQIAGAIPLKTTETISVLRLLRSEEDERFGSRERAILTELVPHVGRVLRTHRHVARARAGQAIAREALDWFPMGVVVTTARGRILAMNRRAEEILADRDGLCVSRGRLVADDTRNDARLTVAIDAVRLYQTPDFHQAINRPSGKRPIQVSIAPITTRFIRVGDQRAAAVVFLHDPDRRARFSVDAIASALGLTIAEARVAVGLAEGLTLQEIARNHLTSRETVKKQCASARAKIGARKQHDLVRLVLGTPAAMAR